MSKNQIVIDIKPKNNLVLDIKPLNSQILDLKPNMVNPTQPPETEQQYSITITAGMYMPLPILTYPTNQTFNSSIAP